MNRDKLLGIVSFSLLFGLGVVVLPLLCVRLHKLLTLFHENRHIWMIKYLASKRFPLNSDMSECKPPKIEPSQQKFLYTGHIDANYFAFLSNHKDDKVNLMHIRYIAFVGTPLENVAYFFLTAASSLLLAVNFCLSLSWPMTLLIANGIVAGASLALFILSLSGISRSKKNDWHHVLWPRDFMYP